jgi:hypothetical protein
MIYRVVLVRFSVLAVMAGMLFAAALSSGCAERRASAPAVISSSPPAQLPRTTYETTGVRATVPAGVEFVVRLGQRIATDDGRSGDRFVATLDRDLMVGGNVVAPRGAAASGRLVEVERAGRVEGKARMTLTLDSLTVNGRTYDINTNAITIEAERGLAGDAAKVGGAAGLGAIVGAIAGGGEGAAIGAAVGAAAGTGVVLSTRGDKIVLDPEQRIAFYLQQPVTMQALRPTS